LSTRFIKSKQVRSHVRFDSINQFRITQADLRASNPWEIHFRSSRKFWELRMRLPSWLLAELAVLQTPKLKTAADSFRQGWKEALSGETLPIEHLWEGIDVE
jgi:hypothetical protein